jgi:hypothetical protein
VAVLQASPVGQSSQLLQPHVPPVMQMRPFELPVQSTHMPLVPQAVLTEPKVQLLFAELQQYWLLLLHSCVEEQVLVHWCVVPSQAMPAGQSLTDVQPHFWPNRQAAPALLPAQLKQAAPVEPHAVPEKPVVQVEPLQQPPLHGCDEEQVLVQVCIVRSHA